MADSILVLQNGKVMEYGRAKEVLENPQNSYTKKLLGAVPRLRRG
jgi:ABC-type glutathione transport system ATPase component